MAISRRGVSPSDDEFLSAILEGYVSAADAASAAAFARQLRGESDPADTAAFARAILGEGDPREAAAFAYELLRESDPVRTPRFYASGTSTLTSSETGGVDGQGAAPWPPGSAELREVRQVRAATRTTMTMGRTQLVLATPEYSW